MVHPSFDELYHPVAGIQGAGSIAPWFARNPNRAVDFTIQLYLFQPSAFAVDKLGRETQLAPYYEAVQEVLERGIEDAENIHPREADEKAMVNHSGMMAWIENRPTPDDYRNRGERMGGSYAMMTQLIDANADIHRALDGDRESAFAGLENYRAVVEDPCVDRSWRAFAGIHAAKLINELFDQVWPEPRSYASYQALPTADREFLRNLYGVSRLFIAQAQGQTNIDRSPFLFQMSRRHINEYRMNAGVMLTNPELPDRAATIYCEAQWSEAVIARIWVPSDLPDYDFPFECRQPPEAFLDRL